MITSVINIYQNNQIITTLCAIDIHSTSNLLRGIALLKALKDFHRIAKRDLWTVIETSLDRYNTAYPESPSTPRSFKISPMEMGLEEGWMQQMFPTTTHSSDYTLCFSSKAIQRYNLWATNKVNIYMDTHMLSFQNIFIEAKPFLVSKRATSSTVAMSYDPQKKMYSLEDLVEIEKAIAAAHKRNYIGERLLIKIADDKYVTALYD